VVGCFKWIRNLAHEAKRLWTESGRYRVQLDYVVMDAKADDAALFREFKRQCKVSLLTHCRKKMNKTTERQEMIQYMKTPLHKCYLKERGFTVEPMPAIMKDIFELAGVGCEEMRVIVGCLQRWA